MLPIGRDPFQAHTHAVDALALVGITPPPEWAALRDRFATELVESMADRYTSAIVNGDDADLAALRAGALAEASATSQANAQVHNGVKAAVTRRLRDLYAPHAQTNYEVVADLFDAAADRLSKAAAVIDPDADPAAVVNADTKTRQAWTDSFLAATELDRLVPMLQAAAELAGVSTSRREALLPLLADHNGQHRRQVWEAFDHTAGRGGRWAALLKVGALVRACRPIHTLELYRAPKPLEERWEPTARGMHQRRIVDPEDQTTEPATN